MAVAMCCPHATPCWSGSESDPIRSPTVLPDGTGFLSMVLPGTLNSNLPNEVIVVLNWREEADQLVREAQ